MKMKIMSRNSISVMALLFASTALASPQAIAQAQSTPETVDGVTTVVIKRGRNVPNQMRRTAEVASFVTAEELKRTGDDNAAEALTRVTGLSIVEGKFIYVRGLGERYSSALLNGSPLPSPEPLQRVVPLDLFPSSFLSRVTVQKTYSPEYSGEFGGGVIDMKTLAAPREPFLQFGIGTGGNSETSLKKGFTHYGSSTDPYGFDDGTRSLPDPLRDAMATGKRVSAANFAATRDLAVTAGAADPRLNLQTIGQSFENARLNLIQETDSIPLNFSVNTSAGQKFDVNGAQIGVIGVLDFSNSWKTRNGIQESAVLGLGGALDRNDDFDVSTTENNVSWNGMLGLSLTKDVHSIQWTSLAVRRTTKRTQVKEGLEPLFSAQQIRSDTNGWYERALYATQLNADHSLSDKLKLNWRANYAVTQRDVPYEKGIRYEYDPALKLYAHDGSRTQNYTRFSNLDDVVVSAGANLAYDFSLGEGRDGKIWGGVDVLDNSREAQSREFRFKASGLTGALPYSRVDFLLSDFNITPTRFEIQEVTGGQGAAAYEADLKVTSAFIKADVAVLPLVRLAGGLRFEDGEMSVSTVNLFPAEGFTPTKTTIANNYVLPAATVTWNFKDDMQVRVGASKTIGRPQFRELAPQFYLDPETDRSFVGNPFLKDTEITNFDARYEYYYAPAQYLTGGFFYKDLTNPIEVFTISDQGGSILQSFVNAPSATLYGLELDAKKLFDMPFKSEFFSSKKWLVQGNYTYTSSEIKAGKNETVGVYSGENLTNINAAFLNGLAMQGQSEHLLNLQFGFEDADAQSQATLLLTYVSERTSARGAVDFPDYTQEPGTLLDFVYRKNFTAMKRELGFSFEARNLLGTEYQEFQSKGNSTIYTNRYELGTSVSLGLTAKF